MTLPLMLQDDLTHFFKKKNSTNPILQINGQNNPEIQKSLNTYFNDL